MSCKYCSDVPLGAFCDECGEKRSSPLIGDSIVGRLNPNLSPCGGHRACLAFGNSAIYDNDERMCRDHSEGYICTLPVGHNGNHVGCSRVRHNNHSWPRVEAIDNLDREIRRYNDGLPVRGNGRCQATTASGMICTRTAEHDGSHAFAWPATAENVLREPQHRCLAVHAGSGMQCIFAPGHEDYHRVVTPDGSDWRWR
jgi:hypothetical protein